MKKIIATGLALTSLTAFAGESSKSYLSAEDHADQHTTSYAHNLGRSDLGIVLYDGPYDSEEALKPCAIASEGDSCIDYTRLKDTQSVQAIDSDNTNADVEGYIYYHAFRNVLAGYYSRDRSAYRDFASNYGITDLIAAEIYVLKSDIKPFTMFTTSKSELVEAAKGAY